MLVRRMDAVTSCARRAYTARRVSSKSLYLPVPRSRREAYALPAIFRESIGCLYSVSDAHARVAGDGKIDRVGDEAMLVRLVVQPLGQRRVAALRDDDLRPQADLGEAHLAIVQLHGAAGVVRVGNDVHARARRFREVGEHMAGRKRNHQQVFGVMARRVAMKHLIGRTRQRGLARDFDDVVARIALVRTGGALGRAGPGQLGAEMMDLRHTQPPPTATTSSSRSPLASAVCAKRLRGTISPLRSTATRLPASCRRSSSAAMSVSDSKRCAAPLTLTSITFWTHVSGERADSAAIGLHCKSYPRSGWLAFCHGTASGTTLILRQFELQVIIGPRA